MSVIIVSVTEGEALELDDYETIINSKQRWKANHPVRLIVGLLLIVFVGATIFFGDIRRRFMNKQLFITIIMVLHMLVLEQLEERWMIG